MPSRCVIPIGIPMIVVMRIPTRSPPLMWRIVKNEQITIPMIASKALPLVQSPRTTNVASLFTIIPAFCIPMNAMNRPIPAPIAFFMLIGIASTISERMFVRVRIMKMIPSMKTAVSANCQEYPIVRQTA